jgi:hypothetical protein
LRPLSELDILARAFSKTADVSLHFHFVPALHCRRPSSLPHPHFRHSLHPPANHSSTTTFILVSLVIFTTNMPAALTTNVDQRLLRTTKFPPEFNAKVDLNKVNVQLIKAWVSDEIAKILKSEDDVVTELVSNHLEQSRYVSTVAEIWIMKRSCVLMERAAKHKRASDPADRLPRQRCGNLLPSVMEIVSECTRQPSRCA